MSSTQKTYQVVIAPDDIKPEDNLSDEGTVLGQLVLSADLLSWEECRFNYDNGELEAVEYIIKNTNFESLALEYVNSLTDDNYNLKKLNKFFQSISQPEISSPPVIAAGNSSLKLGAFLALNYPSIWNPVPELLKEYLSCQALDAGRGDASAEFVMYAPELMRELQKGLEEHEEYMFNEYLTGDRSNDGAIDLIAKEYGAEKYKSRYDNKADTFTFEYESENEARCALHGDYCECKECQPELKLPKHPDTLKELLLRAVNWNARSVVGKRQEEAKKHQEQRKKKQAYKEEQKKKAEEERRAKLKAMTK